MTELEEIKQILSNQQAMLQRIAGHVPLDHRLWTAEETAEYLGVKVRYLTENLALRPGFPKPVRLPSEKGLGGKRWKAREVIEYMEKNR